MSALTIGQVDGPAAQSRSTARRRRAGTVRTLRAGTFLAPHLFGFYQVVVERLAQRLGLAIELTQPAAYADLDGLDLAFLCGLAYVAQPPGLEPLAAPLLRGRRYGRRPVYYSDVIVRHNSRLRCFAELRGRSWAYNEKLSQSGYGVTRFHLAVLGERRHYFGRVVEAGWHARAIRLVADGEVDAAAVDSHVLATYLPGRHSLARQLRVIAALGPSPTQPIAVRRSLPASCKRQLTDALLTVADDPAAKRHFARAQIKRFVAVTDADYDPIRRMRAVADADGVELGV